VGEGILGALIKDARPLRLANLAEDPRSVGFPPNHPPMRSFLGAPVIARGVIFGNIYLTEKRDAPEFSDEDEQALVVLAAQAGVAIEDARLVDELRRRERWLDALREVTLGILEQRPLDDVLHLAAERARDLAGADLATIATPATIDQLIVRTAVGKHAEALEGHVYPVSDSVSGRVIATGMPFATADLAKEGTMQPVAQLGEMGPAVFVPLRSRSAPFGTLCVAREQGQPPFPIAALAPLEDFVAQVAVAVEYDQALRELHRLAVMEDRERIAKELHDGVIQALFAVGMSLQASATISGDAEVSDRIEGAVGEIDRVIRDLRNYIFGLRPGILADRQLDQAIRQLAVEFEERTGVTAVVDVDARVASELGSRAGDIVQFVREALSNVGKHANAATCRVSLIRRGDRAVLEVDDDGRGFDQEAAARRGGNGLRNLRERASGLEGELDIHSSAESGTTVRVVLPL
jgi:signal transduction histidine kinase